MINITKVDKEDYKSSDNDYYSGFNKPPIPTPFISVIIIFWLANQTLKDLTMGLRKFN